MTDAMLTMLSLPGRELRFWLYFRWMAPRIHKQWRIARTAVTARSVGR